MSKCSLVSTLTAVVLLGGCGDTAPPAKPVAEVAVERGVFISSQDCSESKKLSPENCDKAIEQAIRIHETQATPFKTLRQCAAARGPDRCEKMTTGQYRPRLQAFFVVMSNPPLAVPLYPSSGNEIGFLSLTKQAISGLDENLVISLPSQTIAHENAKLQAPDAVDPSIALGAAAADIH